MQSVPSDQVEEIPDVSSYYAPATVPTCKQKCSFWLCRGPAVIFAFLAGFFSFIFQCRCFPCRKKFEIISDDQVQLVFGKTWPYKFLLQPLTPESIAKLTSPSFDNSQSADEKSELKSTTSTPVLTEMPSSLTIPAPSLSSAFSPQVTSLTLVTEQSAIAYCIDTTIMDQINYFPEYQGRGMLAYFDINFRLIRMDLTTVAPTINSARQFITLLPPPTHIGLNDASTVKDASAVKSESAAKTAWGWGKLYLMHGIHHLLKFSMHPTVHFPQDFFISTFRTCFIDQQRNNSSESAIHKLLSPHFQFVEAINYSVLDGNSSVLNANTNVCCCWNAQSFSRQEFDKFASYGIKRWIDPNLGAAIAATAIVVVDDVIMDPLTTISLTTTNKPLTRGVGIHFIPPMLVPFYRVVHDFVSKIIRLSVSDGDYARYAQWIKLLHNYPVFFGIPKSVVNVANAIVPTVTASKEQNRVLQDFVIDLCSDFIFKVSIRHSIDHNGFYKNGILKQPISLRRPKTATAPNVTIVSDTKLSEVKIDIDNSHSYQMDRMNLLIADLGAMPPTVGGLDFFKDTIYNSMFVKWWNNRLCHNDQLLNVDYDFDQEVFQVYTREFHSRFREVLDCLNESVPGGLISADTICKTIEW